MSNHQIDEFELGERTRSWFKDNSGSLITGVTLGLACIFGFQWWQGNSAKQQSEAGLQYQAFVEAADKKDATKSKIVLDLMQSKYADTPYISYAVLRQAELLQSTGKNDEAIKLLEANIAKVSEPGVNELFHLRIARLHLNNGKADLALKQLANIKNNIYVASAEEIRGDAHMALGKRELASASYVKALTATDEATPLRNIVELKLIEAGGEVPAKPGA